MQGSSGQASIEDEALIEVGIYAVVNAAIRIGIIIGVHSITSDNNI